jgi:NAD(P)-dependent dehydrogenase (short-subunit alcohol dehydrogenase family)
MARVKGKVAIVTGAAGRIGRATARLLAREGAQVIVTDADEAGGPQTVGEITASGGQAVFIRHDVRAEDDWDRLVRQVREAFGRIDVLVNNAGIYLIKDRADMTIEDFDNVMSTNVRGVFLGMRACAPVMAG